VWNAVSLPPSRRPKGLGPIATTSPQSEILRRQFVTVRPGVWCFVGNGLSNQSFLEGPEGIIAIDTGESRQEMHEALRQLRQHSTRPIAAVI
jgi:alkyl sulfatase BDS1-like metallo-beta-lactamase superfamily hydrolase